MIIQKTKALILIDIQNDFCSKGTLAVPKGEEVVKIANIWLKKNYYTIATQDWHPNDHLSFASQHNNKKIGDIIKLNSIDQILWPDHCIQNTYGAKFHPDLASYLLDYIVKKGTNRNFDSYSGFYDNNNQLATGLDEHLKLNSIKDLIIMGLATDYCVKYTVLDAIKLGYNVFVVQSGCRGINKNINDSKNAIAEMISAGAKMI